MNADEFEDLLKAQRPHFHCYLARMTGSAVFGRAALEIECRKGCPRHLPLDI